MIKVKDVIKLRIPFPSKISYLARKTHMYICIKKEGMNYEFVKCQTSKAEIINLKIIKNYYEEQVDKNINPFVVETLIDLDKIFITSTVKYDDRMKTEIRSNISDDLLNDLKNKLKKYEPTRILLNEQELKLLNKWIT
ncbi:hypothetical protein ACR34G_02835 [Mycoplasma sp. 480]|uniref:hypothetical protein n=1 Tax=Mycoplasma sp. 480 TaxID=3440155 RepID=UPI003F512B94